MLLNCKAVNNSSFFCSFSRLFSYSTVLAEVPPHHHHHHHHHHPQSTAGYCTPMDYHSTPTTLTPLLASSNPSSSSSSAANCNAMISNCSNAAVSGYMTKSSSSTDLEALNPLPPSLSYAGSYGNATNASQLVPMGSQSGHNNSWSSSYNSLQYPTCGSTLGTSPAQYSSTPTMVLYPQLYSTVNQNQIHLHLHATASADKLEQYLGAMDNSMALSTSGASSASLGGGGGRVEIGIGTSDSSTTGPETINYDQLNVGVEREATGMDTTTTSGVENSSSNSGGSGGAQRDDNRDGIVAESVWRPY